MLRQIITFALAPILFSQGRLVRKNTLRLPEATGPREGAPASAQANLSLIVLGDSAAAGVGVAKQSEALLGQILANLSPDINPRWNMIARTGTTTASTLKHLNKIQANNWDVVVTSLGVNDVTSGIAPKVWLDTQIRMLELLKNKYATKFVVISPVPPMHKLPALPQPLRWYLGAQAKRFNRVLANYLQTQETCHFLDLDVHTEPASLAADGFHPGRDLYAFWGKKVAETINSYHARLGLSQ